MKVVIFLKVLLNVIKGILGVAGFILCCSISAHAGNSKAFDKSDPSSDLILAFPDQWPVAEKVSQSINESVVVTHNNNNETQRPH